MQIIRSGEYFKIAFHYNPFLVERVKELTDRRFDAMNKCWVVPVVHEKEVQQFAEKHRFTFANDTVDESYNEVPPMPELTKDIPLKMKLFPYQGSGVAYALDKKKLIIGDQPGLGKTAQAIATVTGANAFPCLIICPSSLKVNWEREWEMWTNKKCVVLNDSIKRNFNLFWEAGLVQVFIVNYESLKKYFVESIDVPKGQKLRINHIKFKKQFIDMFKSVIIDEVHKCKDSKTLQAKFTKGICTGKEYILALTGTPVINKPKDLISQLGIIDQMTAFGGYSAFTNRYCAGVNEASNLRELNYRLNLTCFYRRDKQDVLKDLPDKMRQVAMCEISTRKEYIDAEQDLIKYLRDYKDADDEKVARSMRGEIMVRIGILKNISARGKLADVFEFIDDILESGEKLVVFAHLKEVISAIKAHYPKAVSVTGDDDMASRQQSVDGFQKNDNVKLIVCSIKAAGVGLTLTASSRVAFVELPWTAADTDQCEDRCIIEGEPILTPDGWRAIESITKGDMVINMYGESVTVKDAWSKGNTKLVTQIHVEGWGVCSTTHDHLYLTQSGWKEAAKLLPGDKIAMPKQLLDNAELTEKEFDSDCRIADSFIGSKGQIIPNGRLIKCPDTIEINDNTLFVFGYFVGDGFASTKPGKGRFISFAGNVTTKQESIDRCKLWIESIGINYNVRNDNNSLGCEIRAYSAEWAMFFEKHFGITAKGKMIPEFLMSLNKRQSGILLNGLMSSDGYYRKNRYEYITSSPKLASQVSRLILRSGYRPAVSNNSTGQMVIAYSLSQSDNYALVQSVTTSFPKKTGGIRPKVYDLTTDKSESFVLGLSVVHNCHRIGQRDSVTCTYFLGQNTIDEYIYKIIQSKREIAATITGSTEQVEENMVDLVANLFTQKLTK